MYLIQMLLPSRVQGAPLSQQIELTRDELVHQFGGATAYWRSPAAGAWTAPTGQVEEDAVVMVEVVAERFDRTWWREYTDRLKTRFSQDSIHVRASLVELLD